MTSLTLKKIGYLLSAVIAGVMIWLITGTQWLQRDIQHVSQSWNELQAVRSEKAQLEGVLRSEVGYGGLLHNYYNYVLRGQQEQKQQAIHSIWGARTALRQYFELHNSLVEQVALQDIGIVLMQYEEALDEVSQQLAQGVSAADIIRAQDIDEALLQRSFQVLRQAVYKEVMEASKARLKSDIRAALGYNGFIHAFKQYVVFGDAVYQQQASRHLLTLAGLLSGYRQKPLTDAEQLALDDIDGVLMQYRHHLQTASDALLAGQSARQVDAQVRVDDEPALRAFIILNQEISHDVERWETSVGEAIVAVDSWMNYASLWTFVGLSGLTILFLWVLQHYIVNPIAQLSQAMWQLAKNNVDVAVPDFRADNELGMMTRSVKAFKANILARDRVEQALKNQAEKIEQQLQRIESLKEESEEKTHKALVLAENLAKANVTMNEAQRRTEYEEQRFRSILEAVQEAVVTVSADGVVEHYNQSAERLFGVRGPGSSKRNMFELFCSDQHDQLRSVVGELLDGAAAINGMSFQVLNAQGEKSPVSLSMDCFTLGMDVKITLVIRDVRDELRWKKEIERLAMHDSLTGLANRNKFQQALQHSAMLSNRLDKPFALLMIDLDRFKPVNDEYGHKVGDDLLVYVGQVLVESCRETDTAARLGGDEFAVILAPTNDELQAVTPAQRIVDILSEPVAIDGHLIQIGASIGISCYPEHTDNLALLQQYADQALYQAKSAGRNTVNCYRPARINQAD